MPDSKWQWMSNSYGGMGWFTDEEKAGHEGTAEFSNGWWRPLTADELSEHCRWVGRMAYEQS